MFRLGLIINPFAGIGGRVALKGSDGAQIRREALALGAPQLAGARTEIALRQLIGVQERLKIFTLSGAMGGELALRLGFACEIVAEVAQPSSAADTQMAVAKLRATKADLILFAGGDGTARDIFEACDESQLVLGIPAGVKIHSGVYAITPEAAGWLVADLVRGRVLSWLSADVMDIDEEAFRGGVVKARRFGELQIPAKLHYVQAVKSGGREVEALVLDDIAAEILEQMEADEYWVIGSGSTCAAVMDALALDNTLLGVDILFDRQIYKADATESDLLKLLDDKKPLKVLLTVIGGQGHVLGRGNQQLSPQVIRRAGWDNFVLIATKQKLDALDGRPLIADTGDCELDHQLMGSVKLVTGYHDYVVYPMGIDKLAVTENIKSGTKKESAED